MIEWFLGGLGAAAAFSARWNWWRPRIGGLAVPMYHKIGDAPRGSKLKKLWVAEDDFRRQCAALVKDGWTSLHFSELAAIRDGRRPLPKKPVVITFDDGYENNFTAAHPVLKEFGLKANLFLVYETTGRHNAWHDPATEPWQRMLDWAQVREMLDSGVWDVGSHTMRHAHLPSLGFEDAAWEIGESKKRLEDKLGRPMLAFGYPYGAGAYDPKIREAVFEAGYAMDFGIRQGKNWPREFKAEPIQRLLIRGDDNGLDFQLNLTRGKSRF